MEKWKDPIKMIQDAQSKGEPIFVLRGKDLCAVKALWAYSEDIQAVGSPEGHVKAVKAILGEFQEYLSNNIKRLKIPD